MKKKAPKSCVCVCVCVAEACALYLLDFSCHYLSAITVPSNIIKILTFVGRWSETHDQFTIMEHLRCVIMRFSLTLNHVFQALGASGDNGG